MATIPDAQVSAEDRGARKEKLMGMALRKGTMAGAAAFGVAAVGTYFLNKHNARFRNFAGISAKVSLPIIASLAALTIVTEHAVHDIIFYPENWDGGKPSSSIEKVEAKPADIFQLNPAKQLLLKIYDHPFVFAGTLSLPLVGHVLSARVAKSHLSLSQALMQTRVVAQFSIISILMATVTIRTFVQMNDFFGCKPRVLSDDEKYSR
jgi:hypothetical protein